MNKIYIYYSGLVTKIRINLLKKSQLVMSIDSKIILIYIKHFFYLDHLNILKKTSIEYR